jgi:single-strand DNA-binding protein
MTNHIQRLMYQGFLGANPEMRYTPTGKAVTNFSLGSSTQYTGANGEVVKTTVWLRVTCWGRLAEVVNKNLEKGSQVIVEGHLKGDENGRPPVFETKSGTHSASFDVTATNITFISWKKSEGAPENVAGDPDEDFPF